MSTDYSDLLKKLQENGYDAAKIAKETGIPQPRIYNWLQGRANPRAKDAELLMELLEGKRKKKAPDVEASDYVANKILKIDATVEVLTEAVGELLARSLNTPVSGLLNDLKRSIEDRIEVKKGELQ